MSEINTDAAAVERFIRIIKDVLTIVATLFGVIFLIRQNIQLSVVLFITAFLIWGFLQSYIKFQSVLSKSRERKFSLAVIFSIIAFVVLILFIPSTRLFISQAITGAPSPTPAFVAAQSTEQVAGVTAEVTSRASIEIIETSAITPSPTRSATPTPTETVTPSATFTPTSTIPISTDGSITAENATAVHQITVLDARAEHLAWSHDGRYLAVSTTGGVKIFSAGTFEFHRTVGQELTNPQIAFYPDGRLATCLEEVIVWNIETGGQMARFNNLSGDDGIAISRDGSLIAIREDQAIIIANGTNGEILRTIGVGTTMNPPVFSPDGQWLASGYINVDLYDVSTGEIVKSLEGHTSLSNQIVFKRDGAVLASVSTDETAKIWDPLTGLLVASLDGHTENISGVDISPDGNVVATISYDLTLRLWDITSAQSIVTLTGHTQQGKNVTFSPDGRYIASSDIGGKLIIWGLEP